MSSCLVPPSLISSIVIQSFYRKLVRSLASVLNIANCSKITHTLIQAYPSDNCFLASYEVLHSLQASSVIPCLTKVEEGISEWLRR